MKSVYVLDNNITTSKLKNIKDDGDDMAEFD